MASAQSVRSDGLGLSSWRTRDFVVSAALAVALGVFWAYAWGYVWLTGRGLSPQLSFILDGFYIVGGVLVGYIVRRPGAALLGEMIAALIEMPLTPFGAVTLWLGFLQGIGVEAIFLAFGYRRWNTGVLLLAGAVGAFVEYWAYDWVAYHYGSLAIDIQVVNVVLKIVGGALLAGLAGKLLGDALAATGVLDNFPIGQGRSKAI
jgi:energy-coupling factor transport system permease protein